MEKIFYILNLFLILFILYREFCNKKNLENFENITLGSADDQNAINKLAQIANQLMAGGVTVPGNLNLQGNSNIEGNIDVKRGSQIKFARDTHQYLAHSADIDGPQLRGWTGGKLSIASPSKDTLIWNNNGVNVSGNLDVQGEINYTGNLPKFGPAENKFTFHTPPDARKGLWITPSTDDANSNWAWHHALNLNRSGKHNLGGELSLSGNLMVGGFIGSKSGNLLTIIRTGQMWDDRGFIERMVPFFKRSDPDGTKIDFMLVHDNGSARFQSGVKYGNVMLRLYQTSMNGGDVGHWGPQPTVPQDVWRINLIQ